MEDLPLTRCWSLREALLWLRTRLRLRQPGQKRPEVNATEFTALANAAAGEPHSTRQSWDQLIAGEASPSWTPQRVQHALRGAARLFLKHWPASVTDADGQPLGEEEIVDRLEKLRQKRAQPPRQQVASTSLQALLVGYMENENVSVEDLVVKRLPRTVAASVVADLFPSGYQLSRDTVYRVLKGTRKIDERGTAYFAFVRAFAELAHYQTDELFSLPVYPLEHANITYGVQLLAELLLPEEALQGEREKAAVELDVLWQRHMDRLHSQLAKPRDDLGLGKLVDVTVHAGPTEEKKPRYAVRLELPTLHHLPPSEVYGWPLLLVTDFARQLQLAWAVGETNVARLRTGRTATKLAFGVHAGPESKVIEEALATAEDSPTGIAMTASAFHHARAQDLRLVWDQALGPGPSRSPPTTTVAVRGFIATLYFSRIRDFVAAFERRDLRESTFLNIYHANPVNTFLGAELATAAFHARRFATAIDIAMQVLAIEEDNSQAHIVLSLSYANMAHATNQGSAPDQALSAHRYHRAICSARDATRIAPNQEDAHDQLGVLHMVRALDGLRAADPKSLAAANFAESGLPLRFLLSTWQFREASASEPPDDAARLLLAWTEDFLRARAALDRGLELSPTRSRSLFWRAICDVMLSAVTGGVKCWPWAHTPNLVFDELGWSEDGRDQLLKRCLDSVRVFDHCMLQGEYLPDLRLAYAMFIVDLVGANKDERELALTWIDAAIKSAQRLAPSDDYLHDTYLMRCWGVHQRACEFKAHALWAKDRLRKEHEAIASSGEDCCTGSQVPATSAEWVPLYRIYLGQAFARDWKVPEAFVEAVDCPGCRADRA